MNDPFKSFVIHVWAEPAAPSSPDSRYFARDVLPGDFSETIRYPAAEANRLGWECVSKLETVEARRKFQEKWRQQ